MQEVPARHTATGITHLRTATQALVMTAGALEAACTMLTVFQAHWEETKERKWLISGYTRGHLLIKHYNNKTQTEKKQQINSSKCCFGFIREQRRNHIILCLSTCICSINFRQVLCLPVSMLAFTAVIAIIKTGTMLHIKKKHLTLMKKVTARSRQDLLNNLYTNTKYLPPHKITKPTVPTPTLTLAELTFKTVSWIQQHIQCLPTAECEHTRFPTDGQQQPAVP